MQKAFGKKSVIFLFIFPAFLIYTAFVIVSIVWAGYYSFFDWSGVGEKVFVGFKNYIELLTQDDVFRSTVWHTLIYTVINVAIQVFGGLLFAILLSRIKKGRVALQTLYYIPVVISSVAICQIFTKLLSVTPTGIVNQVLSFIDPSLKLMEWISNPQISLYVTAFVEAYKYLGLYMVIFYAALIGIIVCGVLYTFVTNIAIDKRVVSTYFGNIAFAYEDYGLPYCFSASLFNTGISEPNGYTKKAMAKIDKDGELNQTATSRSSDELPNIIVVQLESYFDVANAEFFTTSEDACPNLHNLYQNYSNGYFKVPSVGAGTANTEFEVLTGMNLRYFGPGEYPYKTYSKKHPTESAATALASLGYGTHALHDNTGNFYSRANVFNNMGFDTFTSKEFMNVLQTTENGWAKDEILTHHIMEAMDTTKQEDFVFTVSVQGHGNYPETQVIENPKIKVEGIEDEALKNKWEYYVNQVYEMDQFVGDLIKAVEERNEPSVVVFYGDHLPTMGLKAEDLKSRYLYNTNYVIWDNIGLQKDDKNIPAYQLMSEVLNRLDIHSGTVFNYHQQRKGTKNYLSDLELLQYDILYGKQYVYNGKAPITEGHMVMGIRNVSLSSIVPQLNSGYSLYGENFTKYSRVYVNGEKQKSSFLNNTRINLSETELKDGDVIQVGQVGSSDTIFRMSDKYTYQNGQLVKQEGTATDKSKSWVDQDYDVN